MNLTEIREALVKLRNDCLGKEFDVNGAVILSHAIRWIYFKIEGKPYKEATD